MTIKKGTTLSTTRKSTPKKKKVFIEALNKSYGVIQPALDSANICRGTYLAWCEKDPKFALAVEEAGEAAIDFVESQLYSNISKGKEISTIFYLKTRAAHRGYYEKSQLDITSGGEKLVFNFGNEVPENPNLKITGHDE